MTAVPFCILPQYLWYNEIIPTDEASVNFLQFFKETVIYVSQLFSDNGSVKKWHEFKGEYNLYKHFYF